MLDGASYGSHIFIATDAQPFINLPENDILFLSVIRLQNQLTHHRAQCQSHYRRNKYGHYNRHRKLAIQLPCNPT